MTVVRAQFGRWESFWWICYHQMLEHSNVQTMLFSCHPECLNIFHQVCCLSIGFEVLSQIVFKKGGGDGSVRRITPVWYKIVEIIFDLFFHKLVTCR